MAVRDDQAFAQALAFMFKPSAAGAQQMRGIMEKNKKTIADRRKRTMTGMAMSNGLATINGGIVTGKQLLSFYFSP